MKLPQLVIILISIDNNTSLSNQFNFVGLDAGTHVLNIEDDNGCNYEYTFDVQEYPDAMVDFITNESCAGSSNGSVEILSSEIMAYSLDGTNYISGKLDIWS